MHEIKGPHSGERVFRSRKPRTTSISDKQAWQSVSAELRGGLQGSSTFPGFEAKRQLWCDGKSASAVAGELASAPSSAACHPASVSS